jgi:hypothetical protein
MRLLGSLAEPPHIFHPVVSLSLRQSFGGCSDELTVMHNVGSGFRFVDRAPRLAKMGRRDGDCGSGGLSEGFAGLGSEFADLI